MKPSGPAPEGPKPDVMSEAPGMLQDPEAKWPHNEIRAYPASAASPWSPQIWAQASMVIVETLARLLETQQADSPRLPVRHLAIADAMFDNANKCGILITPEGTSALQLRDFLIPSLKVRPRLSLNVKEDFLHQVLGAKVPRTYKALPDGTLIRGLKMMNDILTDDLFELIKVVPHGKYTMQYIVTSFAIAQRIQKKGRPLLNIFGYITFQPEVTYLRATKAELAKLIILTPPRQPREPEPQPPMPKKSPEAPTPPTPAAHRTPVKDESSSQEGRVPTNVQFDSDTDKEALADAADQMASQRADLEATF